MKATILIGGFVLAMAAAPAFASGSGQTAAARHLTDQEFVMNAAKANLAEVELGRIAEIRTSNSEVKDFAKLMVADHQKALDEALLFDGSFGPFGIGVGPGA